MATARLSTRFTKQQVLAALKKHNNVKGATAEELGVSWNGLGTLMADHGIEKVHASQAKTSMQCSWCAAIALRCLMWARISVMFLPRFS